MLNGFKLGSFKFILSVLFILNLLLPLSAAEYTVPRAAYSIYSEDLDLDEDKDIVVGHNYNPLTEWSGVSILENNGYGEFTLIDSVFLYSWQTNVYAKNINNDEFPDIIGRHFENEIQYMAILENNQGIYIPNYYPMEYGLSFFVIGDIDDDNDIDIIVASNSGQFWGVLYNNGTGQFSEPEYHDVTGLHPTDLACGNLNDDDREDILVSGQGVRIYYSYESGFECYIVNDDPEIRVEIADIDNDGDNDIVGLSEIFDIIALTIYENLGDNNFYEHDQVIYEINTPYFKISDLNNDNLPDIVCSGTYGIYILHNEGDLQLSEPQYLPTNTSGLSRPPFCADLDGNGYNDIITIRALFYTGILTILYNDGNGNFVEEPQVSAENYELGITYYESTNYPNPFKPSGAGRSPTTTISFSVTQNSDFVNLEVYNIKGQKIKTLINEEMQKCKHSIVWSGVDKNNKVVSSGIYFYKIKAGNQESVKRMLLLK